MRKGMTRTPIHEKRNGRRQRSQFNYKIRYDPDFPIKSQKIYNLDGTTDETVYHCIGTPEACLPLEEDKREGG